MPVRSCGEAVVALLAARGVTAVFGIPGIHTLGLYRGLAGSGIRHVSPRHEQGAGFMADGFARATGQPGVAFVITGPGLTNIATPLATAYADSVPMLVISAVNRRSELGFSRGRLHELPDQQAFAATLTGFSHTLLDPANLPAVLARAFALFGAARPRPVHIEIPIDVLEAPCDVAMDGPPAILPPPGANPAAVSDLAARLGRARRVVILAGGGAVAAAGPLRRLAELLQAPTILTTNARGLLTPDHPLLADNAQSTAEGHQRIAEADLVLAVGTELSETEHDFEGRGLPPFRALARIDIDPQQIAIGPPPAVALVADAALALEALLDALSLGDRPAPDAAWAAGFVAAFARLADVPAGSEAGLYDRLLAATRDALDRPVIVGDSTRPVYRAGTRFRAPAPRSWFHSATGYGTLGYALPAAIGAQLGQPGRPVVALAGDGGAQFTLPELIAAREAGAPVRLVIWNSHGYAEIAAAMKAAGIPPIGTDVAPPDFVATARAMGIAADRARSFDHYAELLRAGPEAPRLIEAGPWIGG